ncbi:MAG: carbohydrate-binding protein [Myxococcales bacterium]|nr:carbohydrate-binding protein [Myxococcales bacterium]
MRNASWLVFAGVLIACGGPSGSSDGSLDGSSNAGDSASDVRSSDDAALPLDARDDATTPIDATNPIDASDASAPQDTGTPSDAAMGACAPTGRWGMATETFTLPGPNAQGELYVPDVQARFSTVNWATLQRLYIPAGRYTLINLGNLPRRTPDRPLVITNTGGQVVIRPNPGSTQGYLWAVSGGSNWVITGRYDPVSRTGDSAFRGHDCDDYANSRGRYGILSDDIFLNGGHMGIGVSNATSFELDFLEITRSGFAGVRINNTTAGMTPMPLENVRLHDLYIHDTKSEGFYFGWTGAPPSALAERTQVYNNRVIRTGTETTQLQNLGDGSEVHHNVFAWGAIDWRAAFGNFQDNGTQLQFRRGSVFVHHNVVMGGAGTLGNYFFSTEPGDTARAVRIEDNYFADTLSLGLYFGGTTTAEGTLALRRNFFRGMDFGYAQLNPTATDPGVVIRFAGTLAGAITLADNTWEGSRRITDGITGGAGTRGSLTATGNTNGAVTPVSFVRSGYPAAPTRRLEMWTDRATLAPGMPAMMYAVGALVMHNGEMYECTAANTNARPDMSPAAWRRLPTPIDDVRLAPSSPYAMRGIGLQPVR